MSRAERMERTLRGSLAPVRLEIEDESHRHIGHAGHRPEGETHYRVLVVADAFVGETRVARQRRVHALLAAEFATGLHALSLVLRTPEEDRRAAG